MDANKQQFFKIQQLNDMSFDIAAFGENQGIEKLTERVDLNCGAMPPGEYERVIDPSAPEEFLNLYLGIAESRFAYAVTALLKFHPGYITPLENYCFERGKALGPVENITDYILKEAPDKYWSRVDGDVSVYNQLMKAFARGLKATPQVQ